MSNRIQFRRDTAARWKEVNPILQEGELGIETDTRFTKIGDGVNEWNNLDYSIAVHNLTSELGNSENLVMSQKGLTNALADWHGSQQEYNELEEYFDYRWYFIEFKGEVEAIYRGRKLVYAIPNLVGEVFEDAIGLTAEVNINGEIESLPFNPTTLRFSIYYPNIENITFYGHVFKSLDRVPPVTWRADFMNTSNLEYATIDCRNIVTLSILFTYGEPPSRLHFTNTEKIQNVNSLFSKNRNINFHYFTGFDCSSLTNTSNYPFGGNGGPAYMELINIGKAEMATILDLRNTNWGNDEILPLASNSVYLSLIDNSFDRAAAGYESCTLILDTAMLNTVMFDYEIEILNNKGYTIIFQESI